MVKVLASRSRGREFNPSLPLPITMVIPSSLSCALETTIGENRCTRNSRMGLRFGVDIAHLRMLAMNKDKDNQGESIFSIRYK